MFTYRFKVFWKCWLNWRVEIMIPRLISAPLWQLAFNMTKIQCMTSIAQSWNHDDACFKINSNATLFRIVKILAMLNCLINLLLGNLFMIIILNLVSHHITNCCPYHRTKSSLLYNRFNDNYRWYFFIFFTIILPLINQWISIL